MKYIFQILLLGLMITATTAFQSNLTGTEIINRVDKNMSAKNRILESSMTIHGKRRARTVTSKTWSVGSEQSFSEYLSPAREAGTKMLKVEGKLWIYTPATDRTIQIAGHLLRQSVMGSDMSYEDMMDDRKLLEVYTAKNVGKETVDNRECYVLELTAKVDDAAYETQKMWVDTEHFVPIQQELYAKSGKLLKRVQFADIQEVEGRWYPLKMTYKDMLKDGKGTEYQIQKIAFDQEIAAYQFTKAALKQ
ncbi:MAG: outer membrane lipoprotein-sorting protein [Saprospiraceae bacterium]